MTIAILGAAGAIGKAVTRTLVEREVPVRVIGRSEQKLRDAFTELPVEYVSADLATPKGCVRALEGVTGALYTLGLPYTKAAFAAYPTMMQTLLEAAHQTGLRQLILITNVYPYGIPETERVTESHPRNPSAVKARYRKEQEDLLLAAHSGDGLRTLSLRLPDFFSFDAKLSLTAGIFDAAVKGKKADLLGPIDTPHEFMYTPDVGPVVADLFERPEAFGSAYNFGGAGVISIKEFTEMVYAAAGQKQASYRAVQGFMLRVLGLFMPILREMVEMEYLLKTPVILDDSKLRSVLPHLKKTSYEEGIAQTLAAYQEAGA